MSSSEKQETPRILCRGVRGATVARANTAEAVLAATRELLEAVVNANGISIDDVASIFLTTTMDLNATYPALAARQMGWNDTALLCAHEIGVPDGMPLCIRVLLHWNTSRSPSEIVHVYLHEAQRLRPDRQNGRFPAQSEAQQNGSSGSLIDKIHS